MDFTEGLIVESMGASALNKHHNYYQILGSKNSIMYVPILHYIVSVFHHYPPYLYVSC